MARELLFQTESGASGDMILAAFAKEAMLMVWGVIHEENGPGKD